MTELNPEIAGGPAKPRDQKDSFQMPRVGRGSRKTPNFGSMSKREVVNVGVVQSASWLFDGCTMHQIVREHGLLVKEVFRHLRKNNTVKGCDTCMHVIGVEHRSHQLHRRIATSPNSPQGENPWLYRWLKSQDDKLRLRPAVGPVKRPRPIFNLTDSDHGPHRTRATR